MSAADSLACGVAISVARAQRNEASAPANHGFRAHAPARQRSANFPNSRDAFP